ncbi:hypothetical protein [Rathayibacter sp. VKM Ac-2927]|uniref:hypothetical protein n=1 Tax=Rathayibacter sp. VKM Ac-2927 TaxID=2929478 RepID=UPI001FB25E40|nr:hypothetical protein [Rathayibacter sp. VKM Ac-2927]MCJ1687767.1 hypothetical protein [Rathayibacter sp. VKM Ac-2927]
MTDIERAYMGVIEKAMAGHPRSQQKRIGPSEIGDPCDRAILHKLAQIPEPPRPPAWKPAIGTAVHAQLEEWFDAANPDSHMEWVTENTVYVGDIGPERILGSCDLFHIPSGTVIDHKIIGAKQLAHYRANGPSPKYRIQAHLYGLGYFKEDGWGIPREVMIAFLPRDGELGKSYLWHEPWNAGLALEALNRANRLDQLWRLVGLEKAVEISTGCDDPYCAWCRLDRAAADREKGGPLFTL